jgi:flagellar biosynthesis chaperone FliJ
MDAKLKLRLLEKQLDEIEKSLKEGASKKENRAEEKEEKWSIGALVASNLTVNSVINALVEYGASKEKAIQKLSKYLLGRRSLNGRIRDALEKQPTSLKLLQMAMEDVNII